MVRSAPLVVALALAACGPAADESDNPGQQPAAAQADAQSGSRPAAFAQCATCHKTEPGQVGIGPTLAGVYGAQAGHVGDYAYSQAMRRSGLVWNDAVLDRFLASPREMVPGTKMAYPGVKDPAQRQAIVAYLKTL